MQRQEHAVVCLSVCRVLGWTQGAGHFDTLLRPGIVLGSGGQSTNFIVSGALRSGLGWRRCGWRAGFWSPEMDKVSGILMGLGRRVAWAGQLQDGLE